MSAPPVVHSQTTVAPLARDAAGGASRRICCLCYKELDTRQPHEQIDQYSVAHITCGNERIVARERYYDPRPIDDHNYHGVSRKDF